MEHRRSKGWERGVNLRDGETNEDEAAFEWAVVSESETLRGTSCEVLGGPSPAIIVFTSSMRPVDVVPARPELFR